MRRAARRGVVFGAAAGLAAVIPSQAMAHPVIVTSSALVGGGLHSLTGLDHALAMVGVGVLSTRLLRSDVLLLPLAFLVWLAVGAGLGYLGVELRFAEAAVASSCAILGACILSSRLQRCRRSIFAVTSGFGAVHGHAHAIELPAGFGAAEFTVGFLSASALMHVTGVFIGEAFRGGAHRWLMQIFAAAMIAFGVLSLLHRS